MTLPKVTQRNSLLREVVLIVVFCFLYGNIFAQLFSQDSTLQSKAEQAVFNGKFKEAEDLWKKVAFQKAQENKVKEEVSALINVVKSGMHNSNYDSTEHYARLAINRAKSNNLPTEYAVALDALKFIFEFQNNSDSVLFLSQKILDTDGLPSNYYSNAYTSLAQSYGNYGQNDLQVKYLSKAIELDKINLDSSSLPFNLIDMGTIKTRNNLHYEALELFYEALEYVNKKNKFKKATIYCHIGSLFITLKNFEKAEEYGLKALEVCEELDLTFTKTRSYLILGINAKRQSKFKEALSYFEKSDSIFSMIGGRESFKSQVKINIGECLLALNKDTEVKKVIEEVKPILDIVGESKESLNLAILEAEYLLKTNPLNVLKQIRKAEKLCKEFELQGSEAQIYNFYAQYYGHIADFEKSQIYISKANQLKDSIYRNEQTYIVHNLEALYQKKEQASAIKLLSTQNELQSSKLRQQKVVIIGTIAGLILFGGLLSFIVSLLRKVRSQKLIVEKSLEEKEVLLKEIHHRVKNNLQVISSLLSLQAKYIEDEGALNALQQGQDRVFSMALIHQFLYEGENLIGVNTIDYFEQLADNLSYSYNIDEDVIINLSVEEMKLDVDTMIPLGLIVNELVSNAFKHAFKSNTSKPEININLNRKNENLILEVRDNGESITDTESIYNTSFGYELIKAFANKLHAKIDLKVENGLSIMLHINKFKAA